MLVREEKRPLKQTEGISLSMAGVRAPALMGISRILVPVDFSPASMRAFDHAVAMARHFGASLIVLHVMDPMYASGTLHPMTILALKDGKRQEIKRRLSGLAERRDFDGAINVRVVEGSPDSAILEVAARTGCDLIVMGTKGRTGLRRVFRGSIAERVVRHAESPVVVVPDPFKAK